MLLLKFLLLFTGAGLLGSALAMVIYDVYRTRESWRADGAARGPERPWNSGWRGAGTYGAAVDRAVSAGTELRRGAGRKAGVRVSQISGTLPGTLYPGVHWFVPLVQT